MKKILFVLIFAIIAVSAFAQIDPELLKKAESGDAQAQFDVGFTFDRAQNFTKAFEWYSKSAKNGNIMAQNNLANKYYRGQGVAQDLKKSIEWYTKAANGGLVIAQLNLGNKYYHGEGVTQDYKKALEWYTKAANKGNTIAQQEVGVMYGNGKGVPQDLVTGCAWIYLSNTNPNAMNICDKTLNQAQKTQAQLKLKELRKSIP